MNNYLAGLTTEAVNPDTLMIDECTTEQMVQLMNQQDALVSAAIAAEIPELQRR